VSVPHRVDEQWGGTGRLSMGKHLNRGVFLVVIIGVVMFLVWFFLRGNISSMH
jgi:hypothetical protein